MSVLIWDMRGFNNPVALTYLKEMITTDKQDILRILEH